MNFQENNNKLEEESVRYVDQLNEDKILKSNEIDVKEHTIEERKAQLNEEFKNNKNYDSDEDLIKRREAYYENDSEMDISSSTEEEDDDSDEDPLIDFETLKEPLYEGSNVTLAEAIIIIETLSARNGESKVGIQNLLHVLHLLIGPNSLPTTVFKLNKFFSSILNIISYYTLCPNCKDVVKLQTGTSYVRQAVCEECKHSWKRNINDEYLFAMFDLQKQFKRYLETPEINEALQKNQTYRFTNRENIEDIYDGDLYKKLKLTILKSFQNFSVNMFVDGAAFFKSGSRSCWPILLSINELPPSLRSKKLLLAGLWFGPKQPLTHVLFKPFRENLNNLVNEGVTWTNKEGKSINSKIIPLCCCADTVARAKLMNNVQYNGEYGCPYCYNPGRHVKSKDKDGEEKKRGTWKYPSSRNETNETENEDYLGNGIYKERKEKNVREEMRKGFILKNLTTNTSKERKNFFKGFKGPSSMYPVKYFNILWGFPPDWMHCVLLGVVYFLIELWIVSYGMKYYIGSPRSLKKLNDMLSKIKPPLQIHRLTRPITDRRLWKATEFKSFLLYYAIPCLQGILNRKYLKHFALLVEAVGLLLKCGITENDLERSENLLNRFVQDFEKLYGSDKMTFNVHLLLHLSKAVKMCGPLWCFSTFGFESYLRVLKKSVHSSKGVCIQIAESITKQNTLPYLSHTINMSQSAKNVVSKICNENVFPTGKKTINGAVLLGRGRNATFQMLTIKEQEALHTADFRFVDKMFIYNNVICNGVKLSTSTYCTQYKRNNSVVQLSGEDAFARILNILEIENFFIFIILLLFLFRFFIIEILQTNPKKFGSISLSHIKLINEVETTSVVIVEPCNILGVCVYIKISKTESYVCIMPNTTEIQ